MEISGSDGLAEHNLLERNSAECVDKILNSNKSLAEEHVGSEPGPLLISEGGRNDEHPSPKDEKALGSPTIQADNSGVRRCGRKTKVSTTYKFNNDYHN